MTRPVPVRDPALSRVQPHDDPASDPNLVRATFRPGGFPVDGRAVPATPPGDRVLAARLAALEQRVRVLERQAGVRADDDRALMRAIVGSVGACVFTAGELVAHAAIDAELRAVLARYRTAKHVGKRLRALADRPIAGFVLRRVGRDNTGTIWGVQVSGDLHAGACSAEEVGA